MNEKQTGSGKGWNTRRMTLVFMIILSLLFAAGCSASENETDKPEISVKMKTDLATSKLYFYVDKTNESPYHFKIYYDDKEYKEYTKNDRVWSIEYDYSFEETREVGLKVYRKKGDPEPVFTDEIAVVVTPYEYDFTASDLDLHYATRYPMTTESIANTEGNIVSIDLIGDQIEGDIEAFGALENLKYLTLTECSEIYGDFNTLENSEKIESVVIMDCENIDQN